MWYINWKYYIHYWNEIEWVNAIRFDVIRFNVIRVNLIRVNVIRDNELSGCSDPPGLENNDNNNNGSFA